MRLQIILAIVYCFKAAPLVFFLLAMPIVLRLEGYSLIDVGLLQLCLLYTSPSPRDCS